MSLLERLKPSAPRRSLLFLASLTWACAGAVLLWRGFTMNMSPAHPFLVLFGLAGGVAFFRLLFHKISSKHIQRIHTLKHERPCMFSFLSWRSYILMGVMIGGGIALRQSALLPVQDLGTFYIAMGVPLLASSFRFLYSGVKYAAPSVEDKQQVL